MNLHNLSLSLTEALIRSSSAAPERRTGEGTKPVKPSITISREVGALGTTVATEVGTRLGLEVYDKKILEKVGEEMRRPASDLEHVDEKVSNWLEEAIASLLLPRPVNPGSFVKYLLGAIRGLGTIGGAIIVGRGANCILPPETTLRVRLIGDLDERVKIIMQLKSLGDKEARTWMARTEKERAEFVRQTFGVDVTDPHQYDLTLNTSRLSVGECAELIVAQYKRLEARRGASRSAA